MQTIQQYAENHDISYEAARKQVKRYKVELEGHTIVKGRTTYLDDDAVLFLDSRRKDMPITEMVDERMMIITRLRSEIADLQEENENLQAQCNSIKDEYNAKAVQMLEELNSEKDKSNQALLHMASYIEYKAKYELAIEQKENQESHIKALEDAKNDAQAKELRAIMDKEQMQGTLEQTQAKLDESLSEVERLKAELENTQKALEEEKNSYKKSIFGFFRRK